MCDNIKELTFCSCEDKSQELLEYIWTLKRFIALKQSSRKGKIKGPSKQLGPITITKLIAEMNQRNCFDFDYKPEEKDCFRIEYKNAEGRYSYMSLLFRGGKWEEGSHPAFGRTLSKEIAQGGLRKK